MKNKYCKLFLTFVLIFFLNFQGSVKASQDTQSAQTEVSIVLKRPISGTLQSVSENKFPSQNLPKTNDSSNDSSILGLLILVCAFYFYMKLRRKEEV